MIGSVNERRQAIVRLTVTGPGGAALDVDFLLDTGFNGALTLPPETIAFLGLPPRRTASMTLADGTVLQTSVFAASVLWGGADRATRVLSGGAQPLLGMSLVLGHSVFLEMLDGGAIRIQRL